MRRTAGRMAVAVAVAAAIIVLFAGGAAPWSMLPVGVLSMWAWIRDRQRASALVAVRADVAWHEALSEHATASITLADDLSLLRLNSAAARMLGYESAEAARDAWPSGIVADPDELATWLTTEETNPGHQVKPIQLVGRDGGTLNAGVRAQWLEFCDRKICVLSLGSLASFMQDLRRMERADKMDTVAQLAGNVAHDLNNSLAVILAQAEFLAAEMPFNDEIAIALSEIQSSANESAKVVKHLLNFGRKGTHRLQVTDLKQVITNANRILKASLGEGVSFNIRLGPGVCMVAIDPAQFQLTLVNLALNARDAMKGSGQFLIGMDVVSSGEIVDPDMPGFAPTHVRIRVQDTGCGMPPEVLKRVFEPFFTTKKEADGTGLGLATAYSSITGSGGTIDVESKVGVGTTFTIHLPVASPETYPWRVAAQEKREPLPAPEPERPWRILVADDEAALLRVLSRALTRQGYQVVQAVDGEDAVEKAAKHGPIDLLLSDVRMPKLEGPEAAERITAASPATKVLFMTGYSESEVVQRAGLLDPDKVLAKPFEVPELLRRVRGALGIESEKPQATGAGAA